MIQQVERQHKSLAVAIAATLLTMAVGWDYAVQATGGARPWLSFSSDPTLIQPDDLGAATSMRSGAQDINELQRLLQLLAESADRVNPEWDLANNGRFLAELPEASIKAAPRNQLAAIGPRLAGRIDRPLTHDGATAFFLSVIGDPKLERRGVTAKQSSGYNNYRGSATAGRQAVRRTENVGAPIAGDTYSREFLGLLQMSPRLSDGASNYSRATNADRRAGSMVPSAVTPVNQPLLLDMPTLSMTRSADTPPLTVAARQIASTHSSGLSAPVGPMEPRDMTTGGQLTELTPDDPEFAMAVLDGATLADLETPVGSDQLQETRAGFVLNNGVQIDFSVTRLTRIDGVERLQSLANLPQGLDQTSLAQISAGQMGGSQVPALADGSAMFTIVQNNLDNQKIIDITTLDVNIKNLGLRSLDYLPSQLQRDAIPAIFR